MKEYDYENIFKNGASNMFAYALSRANSFVKEKGVTEEKQQITDKETKDTILCEYHDSPVRGHWGMNKNFWEKTKNMNGPT